MRIAVIGTGEMGSAVGARLHERGATVVTSLRGRSAASAERVGRAGIEVCDDPWALLDGAAFVLSIVPPGVALDVAEQFRPVLEALAQKPVYVECNAIAPDTTVRIGEVVAASGAPYVDGGIIGGPPAKGYDGPHIYVSGPDASRAQALAEFGLDVRVLDEHVGHASALKMSYAALTKGLTGIGAALMDGGRRAGVGAALRAELEVSQPQLFAWLSRQVPKMYPKAYRWVAEMEEISAFFRNEDPAAAAIYHGLAALYEQYTHAGPEVRAKEYASS
jgi:3-hydroxyisobutyrate dehydrogenase-like beta-hydroxyacid dehydrogenase